MLTPFKCILPHNTLDRQENFKKIKKNFKKISKKFKKPLTDVFLYGIT